jgi:hypothetical protein
VTEDDPEPFAYSAQQWAAVLATIPPAKAADADLMLIVRQQLETAVRGCLTIMHHLKESPGKQTMQAHDQIKAALDYAEKTGNTPLKADLETALETMYATTQVASYEEMRLMRKGRKDPGREVFHHVVLKIWTVRLGGALTTGRKSDASRSKREADSPAIRFLIATLKPLAAIGPEAAKKIVKAHKDAPGF